MMTDGITEVGYTVSRTEWIKNLIIKPYDTMEQLAGDIMDTALEKNRGVARDDMSVMAMRILSC